MWGWRIFFVLDGGEGKIDDCGLGPEDAVSATGTLAIVESGNNLEAKGSRTSLDLGGSTGDVPLASHATPTNGSGPSHSQPSSPVYWRVEGSLLELTRVRPISFFTWN